mgnify:CR=1 FL=1
MGNKNVVMDREGWIPDVRSRNSPLESAPLNKGGLDLTISRFGCT